MVKKTVLFIDHTCNKSYSKDTLDNESLGGTEATVVRVAEGLAALELFEHVVVEQHTRTQHEQWCPTDSGVYYVGLNEYFKPDYVICLRDPHIAVEARTRFPTAKIYVWSHDLATRTLGLNLQAFIDANIEKNIVVSKYHKQQSIDTLIPYGYTGQFQHQVIYNPIDDALVPDNTLINQDQIFWFSSPHKGLDYALRLFKHLNFNCPEINFVISNPGYYPDLSDTHPHVRFTGPISHQKAIEYVRSSLCVFYPNVVFPETFGLVFAESNAVGTPVLTHSLGAAHEVLDDHPDQFVDCRNNQKVIERVLKWRDGARPTVRVNNKFRLKNVLKEWVKLLCTE